MFLYLGVQTRYFGRWLLAIYPILAILNVDRHSSGYLKTIDAPSIGNKPLIIPRSNDG